MRAEFRGKPSRTPQRTGAVSGLTHTGMQLRRHTSRLDDVPVLGCLMIRLLNRFSISAERPVTPLMAESGHHPASEPNRGISMSSRPTGSASPVHVRRMGHAGYELASQRFDGRRNGRALLDLVAEAARAGRGSRSAA